MVGRLTRLSLTWRFALATLVVVAALGFALVSFLRDSIVESSLAAAESEANDTVARRITSALTAADMATPFEGERLAAFNTFVQQSVVSARTARIKIWNREGRVIYADEPVIIGQYFPIEDELRTSLAGRTASKIAEGERPENEREGHLGRLLEVYTPVTFPGESEPAGVFEIYQVYAPVAGQVAAMQQHVVFTLGGGLLVLYLALLGFAKGAGLVRGKSRELARTEQRFQELLDSVDAIVWEADARTFRFTFVSEQAERILGYPAANWLSGPTFWADHIHPADRDATVEECSRATADLRNHSLEYRMTAADGRVVWLQDLVTVECEGRQAVRLRGVMFDVTRRKEADEAIWRLASIVESTDDVVIGIDLDGVVATWNAAAERLSGLGAGQVIGRRFVAVLPEYEAVFAQALEQALKGERIENFETRPLTANGRTMALSVSVFPVTGPGGRALGLASIMRDVTERKQLEERLAHLASHDELTGLLNRRRFEEELERQCGLARRLPARAALLFLDLDGFKGVNDSYGHSSGDELLVSLAGVLRRRLRDSDILARLGGDEFAVFLHDVGETEALAVARDLCAEIRQHKFTAGRQTLSITASVGIALLPDHASKPADLLVHADLAMYQAKEEGRDRVCLYHPDRELQAGSISQLNWERRIRDALRNNRFLLYGQIISDLRGGPPQCELLLRMVGESGTVVLPGAFLPVAERSDLIHAIDRWVVTRAIGIAAEAAPGPGLSAFAVNLSAASFDDAKLIELIESELARTGLDPRRLVFEIQEAAAMADVDQTCRFAGRLRVLGCQVAVDNCRGAGSALACLPKLPIDRVKLHGSLIQNLPNDVVAQQTVRATVEMAQDLGLSTVAQLVRDDETIHLLREYGVDMAQGYHVGRPAPLAELSGAAGTLHEAA